MSDNNLVSIAGNPTGELFLVDKRNRINATTKLREAGDLTRISVYLGDIISDASTTDSLKVSGAVNVDISAGRVRGGIEDVVDINHSQNVSVSILEAEPTGKYLSTIKGSTVVNLKVVKQISHGKEVDCDLGNWKDEGNVKTTDVTLNSTTSDGSQSTYRTLNATQPILAGGSWKKLQSYPPWLFLLVMKILKFLHLA